MKKIFVAGHNGMVGASILRELSKKNNIKILTANRSDLDLSNQSQVDNFFKKNKPHEVYLAAAKVGGIEANNSFPADFISTNLKIQSNVILASLDNQVKKLLFLGSSCIYPKMSKQPIKENYLLTGPLEETNEPYALAKISGLKLCESLNRQFGTDYRSVMPTNLYGPGDNFNLDNSHVIPALIRKIHEAKEKNSSEVVIWGSGKPKREFLYVEELAKASVFLMNLPKSKFYENKNFRNSHVNIGTGEDIKISKLAFLIKKIIKFKGSIIYDSTKNDGTPRKLLDVNKLNNLGWKSKISLKEGLEATYDWYLNNLDNIRM